ncbi:MAG: prepilin-type N-terminal cleavage/methylation domain-containing protein [Bacillota bacterium]
MCPPGQGPRSGSRGYTLVEVVAALAVFSLVAAGAVTLVLSATSAYGATGVRADASHYLGLLTRELARDAARAERVTLLPQGTGRKTVAVLDGAGAHHQPVSVRYRFTADGEVVREPLNPPGPGRVVARGLDPAGGLEFRLSGDGQRLQVRLLFRDGPDRWEGNLEVCLMECLP